MRTGLFFLSLLGAAALSGQALVEDPRPIPDSIPATIWNTNQFQRFWDLYTLRSSADNQIPDGVRQPAATVMTQTVNVPLPNTATSSNSNGPSAPPPSPLFTGNRWKAVGPAPINNGQIGATVPGRAVSGRMSAIAIDPNNSNHWLVGGAQGGVWETLNAGANWVALTDALPSLAIGAIAIAPTNSRIIYVGTGEPNNSGDSYGGLGVFKTTDGGVNWTRVNSTLAYASFSSLWVDPANSNILLATLNYGVFGRAAFFPPSVLIPPVGVYRSTDGGVTWTPTVNNGRSAYAMSVNPANKQQAIVGISSRSGSADAANGVYRTFDNGQTWSILASTPWNNNATGVGRIELTIAASQPATAYVSVERPSSGALLGLWRTDNLWDATPVWTQISVAGTDSGNGANGYCGWDRAFSSASNQCWYSHTVLADATNPNVLYAGGVPLWKFDGTTWTEISHTTANISNGMHVDQHALAWAGTRLVVGNDGGIWSTTDGGATINDHNAGLATVQFYEGTVSTLGGQKRYLGGAQDNGTPLTINGGSAWNLSFGGDGAATSFSPATTSHWFVSSQNLNLVRTINGVNYASTISGLDRTSVAFIAKVEQCPWDENVVLAGNRSTQKRVDYYSGASNGTWPASGAPFSLSSGVSALAFGSACSVYAVGSKGKSFFTTRDGGVTWTNLRGVAGGTAALVRPASDFAFQPGDDTVMWVALSAFNQDTPATPGHVVKITGLNTATPAFQLIDTGLNMPHNTIVVDPGNTNVIYVGTDMGVMRSTNGGASWLPMGISSGMPNVAVHDLKYSADGVLVAFTHGRGAFELTSYDITGDSAVTCADLNVIKLSYNKKSGQSGFNPLADLNNDGYVDVRDLRMMTSQLPAGTVCP